VVLRVGSEALVGGIERYARGHSPRHEYPAVLKPHVVVESSGGVFLDHEEPTTSDTLTAERLRCSIRGSLCPIRHEAFFVGTSHTSMVEAEHTVDRDLAIRKAQGARSPFRGGQPLTAESLTSFSRSVVYKNPSE
jgi:hypothetical protein